MMLVAICCFSHQAWGAEPAVKGLAGHAHALARGVDAQRQQRHPRDARRQLGAVCQQLCHALRVQIKDGVICFMPPPAMLVASLVLSARSCVTPCSRCHRQAY